jgi:cell division protein FtsQ
MKYSKIHNFSKHKQKNSSVYAKFRIKAMRVFFVLIAMICAVYFSGDFLHSFNLSGHIRNWARSNDFVIEDIYIQGLHQLRERDVIAASGVLRGESIFKKSPWEMKESIAKLQWVRSVIVDRQLPNKLYLGIVERKPIAIKQFNQKLQLIDENGYVFSSENVSDFAYLPIFVGEDVEDYILFVLGYLKKDIELYRSIDFVQRIANRRWDVVLHNKIRIKLPESNEEVAWETFVKMYNNKREDFIDAQIVDLRIDKKVFIEKRVK